MEQILLRYYGLTNSSHQSMVGYISLNFRIKSDQGQYVLKIYDYSEWEHAEILAETALIEQISHLNEKNISRPVHNNLGESITVISTENGKKIYRLLSYVEGIFLAEAEHTPSLYRSLGKFMGQVDLSLLNFRSTGIESRKLAWDLQNIHLVRPLIDQVKDPNRQKLVEHFFVQWDLNVYPKLSGLRQSIIHNDGNDWNVLVNNGQITGIIDFGDSVYTALINELAITMAYALLGKETPLDWASHIIEGFHDAYPLEKKELDILYYLIAGRLITTVCKSAVEKTLQPDKEYITISEEPAWRLLAQWIQINPIAAKNSFYEAAGFSITPVQALEEVVAKRRNVISASLSLSYSQPIHMASAAFQYMFDQSGNTYLDAYNNIAHVGHQHPSVVAAIQNQAGTLNTNTRYLYDSLSEYGELLLSKFPSSLNKVFFVNSGSAASDLAVRLAQNFTARKAMAVMEHGYHGNTRVGIDISHYKYTSKGGKGRNTDIIEAPIPDGYRGKYKGVSNDVGESYANDLIQQLNQSGKEIAGFISEPIVGCGGQVPLAPGYLTEVYQYMRSQGGVCISDEVQTGFGRLGEYFWGYEMQQVVPDIVVLGKPMGNGHPIGAVVTTDAIADAFDNGMEFFSSFGGNPVSCEVGKAVLSVIEKEKLQENALHVGNYFKESLKSLQTEFPVIGDIRGNGLFLGLELIKDDNLRPNTELAQLIMNEFRNKHILISTDGPYDSVIKSKPPLCFSKENVDQVIHELFRILKREAR